MTIEVKTIEIKPKLSPLQALFQNPQFLKTLGISLIVFIVIALIGTGYSYLQEKRDSEVQASYFKLETEVLKIKEELNKNKETLSLEKVKTQLDSLKKIAQENNRLLGGALAGVLASDLLSHLGQDQEALELIKNLKIDGAMGELVTYRKLTLMSNLNQWETVTGEISELLNKNSISFLESELRWLYSFGLNKQQKVTEAKTQLEKLSQRKETETRASFLSEKAKKYLKMLNMKKGDSL